MRLETMYEDEDLLACNKPAGIVTHATLDVNRQHFYGFVKSRLPSEVAEILSLHHRLDAQTSGLLLFGKSHRVNEPLQALFREHRIQKTYIAVTHVGSADLLKRRSFTVKNFLALSKSKPARSVAVRAGGKSAHTDFKILKATQEFWIVEAKPRTGRTHQIRTHLSELGIPLVADVLYEGKKTALLSQFLLHAHRLEFEHPLSKEKILIESPIPASWKTFRP